MMSGSCHQTAPARDRFALPHTSVRVRLPVLWSLLPGAFEIEYTVAVPRTAGANVYARIGGALRIGEAFVGVSVSVPELDLEASLLEPLPVAHMVGLFLPGAQVPPMGEVKAFSAWINARSKNYRVALELAGLWAVGDVFALTGIESVRRKRRRRAAHRRDRS
ncbi:hypothetical protein [Streptomyces noursei]|uniref:hypothetical protein n=1 Tax=Streptomyces noursei TaxID=1971 RepID=UPI0019649A4D|nr:hypothetical protein [Streptomyces noursei]QRX90461.1 hypothetical protein JNO44_06055 [Streptomyces noursei]